MKKLVLLFSLAALTAIGFSCAKKDNNNNFTPTYNYDFNTGQCKDQTGTVVNSALCSSNGFQLNQFGQCIQTATGQPAAPQLCQQQGNGMYSCVMTTTGQVVSNQLCMSNNFQYACIQTTTRQPVANQLCQQAGVGGFGTVSQQCYGPYIYSVDGRLYQCGITTNCSGALMTSQQTGQQVQCL